MLNRNWRHYNKQLIQRGSLTFLIDPKTLKSICAKSSKNGPGRPQEYSNSLIQALLVIKTHFRLAYRALEGFAKSILPRFLSKINIPTYSLICKRVAKLGKSLPKLNDRKPSTIIVDSTGMKVIGEGEWKVKIHGRGRPRKWVKVHIAIDPTTQEIVAETTTESSVGDSTALNLLLEKTPATVKTVLADGAYDGRKPRKAIREKGAVPLVPPPRNARYRGSGDERDDAILILLGLGNDRLARSLWGKLTGYNRRVLVETAFSSMKRMFGDRFYSKTTERQCVENTIRCLLLNKMRRLAE